MQKIYRNFAGQLLLGFCLCISASVYAVDWNSYTMVVNQHKLHYYQSGSGKPLVLLTGYATTSNFWNKKFVNCLAQTNSVYLVDYWGINTGDDATASGNASINDMAADSYALVNALHLSNPILVGWSMGGAVAQQMNFTHADEFSKVILIAPLSIDNQPVETSTPKEVVLNNYTDVLNYVFTNNLYDYTPRELHYYKNSLFAPRDRLFPNNKVGINQHLAMNTWSSDPDTLDAMQNSEANYLFLIANQDKMLNPAKTELDARQFQHAHIVKFQNSGHNIAMQAPEMACAQIENFIK